jgi:hypothetical protein
MDHPPGGHASPAREGRGEGKTLEQPCKPGFVPGLPRAANIHPGVPLPTPSSEHTRETWAGRPCPPSRSGAPYWLLHRVGFAVPTLSPGSRCALTAPFHPYPRERAVCFLWHCPAAHADWPLASTLPCGARTFLPPPRPAVAGVHPDCSSQTARSTPPAAAHLPVGQAMRSSMARFDISSAARFISRGTCTNFTRSKSFKRRRASWYSGLSEGLLTW